MPIAKKTENYEHLKDKFLKLKLLRDFYNFDHAFLGRCLTYSLNEEHDKNTYNYFMSFLKSKKIDSMVYEDSYNINLYKPLLLKYIDLFRNNSYIIQKNALADFYANDIFQPGLLSRSELSFRNQQLSVLKKILKIGAITKYQFFKDLQQHEIKIKKSKKESLCNQVHLHLEIICFIVSLYLNNKEIEEHIEKEILNIILRMNLDNKNTKEKKIKI